MPGFYQAFPLSVCCIRLDRSGGYTGGIAGRSGAGSRGKVSGTKLCVKARIDIAYLAMPSRDGVAWGQASRERLVAKWDKFVLVFLRCRDSRPKEFMLFDRRTASALSGRVEAIPVGYDTRQCRLAQHHRCHDPINQTLSLGNAGMGQFARISAGRPGVGFAPNPGVDKAARLSFFDFLFALKNRSPVRLRDAKLQPVAHLDTEHVYPEDKCGGVQ